MKVATGGDVLAPERLLRPKLVMRSASDADIRDVARAPEAERVDVVELQKCPRRAAMAIRPDERALLEALLAVAREDLPAHFARDARTARFTITKSMRSTIIAPRRAVHAWQ